MHSLAVPSTVSPSRDLLVFRRVSRPRRPCPFLVTRSHAHLISPRICPCSLSSCRVPSVVPVSLEEISVPPSVNHPRALFPIPVYHASLSRHRSASPFLPPSVPLSDPGSALPLVFFSLSITPSPLIPPSQPNRNANTESVYTPGARSSEYMFNRSEKPEVVPETDWVHARCKSEAV